MRIFNQFRSVSMLTILAFVFQVISPAIVHPYHSQSWLEEGIAHGTIFPEGGPVNPEPGDPPLCSPTKGDPIYLWTGEFFYSCTDLTIPGRGMNVVINHTYRGGKAFNGQFGTGWFMSYHYRIRPLSNGNIVLISGEGRKDEYVYDSGTYVTSGGIFAGIVQNGNGSWTLTKPNGTQYEFDMTGKLTAIIDRNGNQISFTYTVTSMPIYAYPLYPDDPPLVSSEIVGYDYLLTKITDTIGNEIDFTYNSENKLQKITDHASREVSFSYDSATGDLLTITRPATTLYPSGITKTFTYDANHKITSIKDGKNQTFVTNRYDSEGRVYEQDLGTGTYQFSYGVDSTTVTDRNGYVTTYTFDSAGNLLSKELFTDGLRSGEPASYLTTYTYNANSSLTSVTFPLGNGIKYTYDENNSSQQSKGNLIEVRQKANMAVSDNDTNDIVTEITYESNFNQVNAVTDPKGNAYTITYDYELDVSDPKYDTKGNAIFVEQPEVNSQTPTWEYTYNSNGQITEIEDPNGNIVEYTYHSATGYLHQIKQDPSGINAITTYTYDSIGNIDTVTDAEGRVTDYDFNELRWLLQVENDLGYVTKMTHDKNGNVTKLERQVNAAATVWQDTDFTYDTLNNLETRTDPLDRVTTHYYDDSENLTSIVDAESNTTTNEYDERHLLFKVKDANTPQGVTQYDYDDNGNLAQITDSEDNETTYGYDGFDRLTSKTYDDSSGSTYTYDKNSNLVKHTTPKGDDIDYTYDALNRRLTKEFESDADLDVSYAYDLGSRMTTADTTASEIDYTYDALNRVTETTQRINANNFTVEYDYDKVGNRTQITYPSTKVVDYTYDDLNRMTHVDVDSSALVEYAYDPLNRRAEKSFLSADLPKTTYEYDLANQLEAQVNAVLYTADTVTNQLSAPLDDITNNIAPDTMSSQFVYLYDNVGNRTDMNATGTLGTTGTFEYDYNDIYELEGVSNADSHSYAYDNVGNRNTVDSVSYSTNSLNEYTSVGATSFMYDGNDNLSYDGTNSYTYDEDNRLISASNSSNSASYEYDAFNRRISKTVDSVMTYYVYDGYEVIEEYNSSNSLQAYYVLGPSIDEPNSMVRNSNTYYYHRDALGNVRQLTDVNGIVQESYDYDPYGNVTIYNSSLTDITSSGSGIKNPYMYAGRRLDEESGVYHYRNRQYKPMIGRFLQRDPLGYVDGMNLYTYVGNNSINHTDPFGLQSVLYLPVGESTRPTPGILPGIMPLPDVVISEPIVMPPVVYVPPIDMPPITFPFPTSPVVIGGIPIYPPWGDTNDVPPVPICNNGDDEDVYCSLFEQWIDEYGYRWCLYWCDDGTWTKRGNSNRLYGCKPRIRKGEKQDFDE